MPRAQRVRRHRQARLAGWLAVCPLLAGQQQPDVRQPYNPVDLLETPNTLNEATAANQNAIATAVTDLNTRGIPLNASIGSVQHFTRTGSVIRDPGLQLRLLPGHRASFTGTTGTTYGEVSSGNCFVMFAEMDPDNGPRAEALLTYSQSEDPTSPFYKDQTQRYSDGDFITLPFTAAAVEAAKLYTATIHDARRPRVRVRWGRPAPGSRRADGSQGPVAGRPRAAGSGR